MPSSWLFAILASGSAACGTHTGDHGSRDLGATLDMASRAAVDAGGSDGGGGGGADAGSRDGGGSGGDGAIAPRDAGRSDGGEVPRRESLLWVWANYGNALDLVVAHKSSFTQVSPALYQLNYDYQSGAAQQLSNNFDGLSPADISQRVHDAGMTCIPLIYAGSGNSGTDQGIRNVLDDAPAGAQKSFIDSMVQAAQDNHYDGYNLDWEVGKTGHDYSNKLVSFLVAFRDALHAQHMTLSLDIADWYMQQCSGSGGNGFVDLTTLGNSVDWAIIEDYTGALGQPRADGCASAPGATSSCTDFGQQLDVMCKLPPANVSIGLISPQGGNGGTNLFAGDALDAVATYGFRAVALWPDDSGIINSNHISPTGSDWYALLAAFLARP